MVAGGLLPARLTFVIMAAVGVATASDAARADCGPGTFAIAIDVGHSPDEPGAISARGRAEFDFNQDLAWVLRAALHERGFVAAELLSVFREIRSLDDRTAAAAAMNAQVFLSVHHDSVQERYLEFWQPPGADTPLSYSWHAEGYSLFVSEENPFPEASLFLARLVGEELQAGGFRYSPHHAEPIPGEGRELLDAEVGVYRFDRLFVLRRNHAPAMLIEAGVIKHPDEELRLQDPAFQAAFAAAVAEGVVRYCEAFR
ncbi:MAG: N-acetylmuramoyl-L-alanine amidase [Geminicoccaceae bacterium]|nr:MAG: N-acetylmuramoyl-L-alanine amidase [Geminicoccaceae bacterium]